MLQGALKMANEESMKETSRTATVDGKRITFSLVKNVSQRPETSRAERTHLDWRSINVNETSAIKRFAVKARRWLTKRDIPMLTMLYLAAFLGINALFALIFYYGDEGRCCEDPTMTYAQVFDFVSLLLHHSMLWQSCCLIWFIFSYSRQYKHPPQLDMAAFGRRDTQTTSW